MSNIWSTFKLKTEKFGDIFNAELCFFDKWDLFGDSEDENIEENGI